jgi:hypothetical protein
LASLFVFEGDLVEPGEGVADMGRVVYRQSAVAARVDVREGGVRKLGPLSRLESPHDANLTTGAAKPGVRSSGERWASASRTPDSGEQSGKFAAWGRQPGRAFGFAGLLHQP